MLLTKAAAELVKQEKVALAQNRAGMLQAEQEQRDSEMISFG